jgi:hypothetical protein
MLQSYRTIDFLEVLWAQVIEVDSDRSGAVRYLSLNLNPFRAG